MAYSIFARHPPFFCVATGDDPKGNFSHFKSLKTVIVDQIVKKVGADDGDGCQSFGRVNA